MSDEGSTVDANPKFALTCTEVEAQSTTPKHAIVTCMDARINEANLKALGMGLKNTYIIRNAGGSAREALRSLIVSQHLIDTQKVMVVKHTHCGMATTNEEIRATVLRKTGRHTDMDFLPFTDVAKAVKEDVDFLKAHELLRKDVKDNVSGWVLELEILRKV